MSDFSWVFHHLSERGRRLASASTLLAYIPLCFSLCCFIVCFCFLLLCFLILFSPFLLLFRLFRFSMPVFFLAAFCRMSAIRGFLRDSRMSFCGAAAALDRFLVRPRLDAVGRILQPALSDSLRHAFFPRRARTPRPGREIHTRCAGASPPLRHECSVN